MEIELIAEDITLERTNYPKCFGYLRIDTK